MTVKRILIRLSPIVLILLTSSLPSFPQTEDLVTRKLIWRVRADSFTDRIVKQAFKLNELEQAIWFAKIGRLWVESDKNKANVYFEKSVDRLFFYSTEESKEKNRAYISAIRDTLAIIANRSPKQTNRLVSILSDKEKVLAENNRLGADALIEFALAIVTNDSVRATDLGILSFRFGQPTKFYQLFWALSKIDPALADRFFRCILKSANDSPNPQIAQNVKLSIFPNPQQVLGTSQQRAETLRYLANYINLQQIRFTAKLIDSCVFEAYILASIQSQFPIYLPEKTNEVIQSIAICIADNPSPGLGKSKTGLDQIEANSIEEMLKLAEESNDNVKKKAYYLFRAVSLANDQNAFRIGIEILEGMSTPERETDNEFWDTLRYSLAGGLAFQQVEEGNYAAASETLNRVPSAIRLFAKVGFAFRCSSKNTGNRSFCIANLDEALIDFPKSEKSLPEKYRFWLLTVRLYAENEQPVAAAAAFESLVKSLNIDLVKRKENSFHIATEDAPLIISPELLESQEQTLLKAADLLEDDLSRISVNYSFLTTALEKVEQLNKPTMKIQKVPSL